MSVFPALDSLSLVELQDRFRAPPPDDPDLEDYLMWYEELAIAIRERDPDEGARFLRGEVAGADPDRLTAILLAITWFDERDRGNADLLIEGLEHPDEYVAAQAIDGLAGLGGCGVTERILALRTDSRAGIRSAVLRFAREVVPDRAPALLLDALHDPHYIVRWNAIDELDELNYAPARPRIDPLRADPHPRVRAAALSAIAHLAPADAGIPMLLDALHDPDAIVRLSVVMDLDQLEQFTERDVFERMIDDPDEEVGDCARSALQRSF